MTSKRLHNSSDSHNSNEIALQISVGKYIISLQANKNETAIITDSAEELEIRKMVGKMIQIIKKHIQNHED